MQNYQFNVKVQNGCYIRIVISARTIYEAEQQAKVLYGSNLISSAIPLLS